MRKVERLKSSFIFYLFIFLIIHLYFFGSETTISQKSKAAILAETVLCWIDNWQKKKQGNEEKEVK